jgi:hypothetical protein
MSRQRREPGTRGDRHDRGGGGNPWLDSWGPRRRLDAELGFTSSPVLAQAHARVLRQVG